MSTLTDIMVPGLTALEKKFDSLQELVLAYKARHDALVVVVRQAVRDLALARSADDAEKIQFALEDALDECEAG